MKIIIDFNDEKLKDLNLIEMCVYSYIKGFGKKGTYTPITKMCEIFKQSRPTLTRTLNKLVNDGLLLKKSLEHYRNNLYIAKDCINDTHECDIKSNNNNNNNDNNNDNANNNIILNINKINKNNNYDNEDENVNDIIEGHYYDCEKLQELLKKFVEIRKNNVSLITWR